MYLIFKVLTLTLSVQKTWPHLDKHKEDIPAGIDKRDTWSSSLTALTLFLVFL